MSVLIGFRVKPGTRNIVSFTAHAEISGAIGVGETITRLVRLPLNGDYKYIRPSTLVSTVEDLRKYIKNGDIECTDNIDDPNWKSLLDQDLVAGGGVATPATNALLPPFIASNAYLENQAISENGRIYVAKVNFTSGAIFIASDWTEVSPPASPKAPDWSNTSDYKQFEMTIEGGKLYRARADHAQKASFDPADWEALSSEAVTVAANYSSVKNYVKHEIVYKDGSLWRTKAVKPAGVWDETLWDMISDFDKVFILDHSDTSDYEQNEVVAKDGKFYRCSVTHTAKVFDVADWEEISPSETFLFDHDPASPYKAGNVVLETGFMYRCKADIAAKAFDVSEWDAVTAASPHLLEDQSDAKAYKTYEVVYKDGQILRCKTDIAAKAFDVADWTVVSDRPSIVDYDGSSAYPEGQYVQHEGKLYRANSARVAGVWPATPTAGTGNNQYTLLSDRFYTEFNLAHAYIVGDVIVEGGKLLACKTPTTTGNAFNAGEWTVIGERGIYRGKHSTVDLFVVGDVVHYNGGIYECKTAHGTAGLFGPFVEANFDVIIKPAIPQLVIGTGPAVDDVTVAEVVDQIYVDKATGNRWVATAPATDATVDGTGSAWDRMENIRVLADETTVAPAVATKATEVEIKTFCTAGNHFNTIVIYTGTDLLTDTVKAIYWVDNNGNPTLIYAESTGGKLVVTDAPDTSTPVALTLEPSKDTIVIVSPTETGDITFSTPTGSVEGDRLTIVLKPFTGGNVLELSSAFRDVTNAPSPKMISRSTQPITAEFVLEGSSWRFVGTRNSYVTDDFTTGTYMSHDYLTHEVSGMRSTLFPGNNTAYLDKLLSDGRKLEYMVDDAAPAIDLAVAGNYLLRISSGVDSVIPAPTNFDMGRLLSGDRANDIYMVAYLANTGAGTSTMTFDSVYRNVDGTEIGVINRGDGISMNEMPIRFSPERIADNSYIWRANVQVTEVAAVPYKLAWSNDATIVAGVAITTDGVVATMGPDVFVQTGVIPTDLTVGTFKFFLDGLDITDVVTIINATNFSLDSNWVETGDFIEIV